MLRKAFSIAIVTGLLALVGASPAAAVPAVTGEFDVPGLGNNNKLVQGPDGNMWVTTGGGGNDVARITPAGEVKEFNLEAVTPSGITVGPEGKLWITRNGDVISFSPANPEGTKTLFPIADIGTQHSIVLGPDKNLWVATNDKVLRIPPSDPTKFTKFEFPGLAPKDIDVAGSRLVIADFKRILEVSTAGIAIGEHKILNQSQGVAGNPNGQYAYSQPTEEPREFGVITPGLAPVVTTVTGKDPFGVALGSDDAYWAPEFNSDGLLRITPAGLVTGLTGFAKNSAPRQIAPGPNNTLWVTLEMTKKVGRVSGLEPPVIAPPSPPPAVKPETKIEKGPKGKKGTTRKLGKAKFKFSSTDPTAGFECRLLKLTKPGRKAQGSAMPKQKPRATPFKACKSPKAYWLPVGRYRFEVRAVNAAGADPSPAKSSFHVVRILPKRTSH